MPFNLAVLSQLWGISWSLISSIIKGGIEAFKEKDWQREEWKILVGIVVGTFRSIPGFLLKDILPETCINYCD